jgi:hypothetical protein
MATSINVPDQPSLAPVKLSVSTRKGEHTIEFDAELPKSLGDAVALLGERSCFKRVVNSYAVYLQSQKRAELQKTGDEQPKQRTRAAYLSAVGL